MFKENIFEGACATSTMEVLLIIAGSIALGLLLGYLIWGWLRKQVNELEEKIIQLSRKIQEQETAIEELTAENESLSNSVAQSKREFDLKSSQYTSAITRIRSLEEQPEDKGKSSPATKKDTEALQAKVKSQENEIKRLQESLKSALAQKSGTLPTLTKTEAKSETISIPDAKTADRAAIVSAVTAEPVKKRRGRPKKVVAEATETTAPKRGRGRPKKVKSDATSKTDAPKRGRGRPKKVAVEAAEVTAPKRGRGRPKKVKSDATSKTEAPKRGRGRPKKVKSDTTPKTDTPKRGRGRPKKVVVEAAETTAPKRGRGRPKKVKSDAIPKTEAPKRGRGRPKKVVTEAAEIVVPKRRGRPKKVKSDATPKTEAPKRGRGRPKKVVQEEKVQTAPKRRGRPRKVDAKPKATQTKGRRGRPKGSKNKAKSFSGAGVIPQASEVFGKRIRQDDLTVIEGIGPKIAELFKKNKLESWDKVSNASIASLRETIEKVGPRHHIHDPSTWARQATMAKKGEWKRLKVYQDTLNRGRK